jgi:hypothetical protein
MSIRFGGVALISLMALAGCAAPVAFDAPIILTEDIIALLPAGQDISDVRELEDGCYWYLHYGPVEATYIPLLTTEGRGVCTPGYTTPT